MTVPVPPSPPRTAPALLRPRVFFPLLIVLIVASVLVTPHAPSDDGSSGLSSYSAKPGGARGFATVASRLGWTVSQTDTPLTDSLPVDAVYAVLVPSGALTTPETARLLSLVRRGAGLIAIVDGGALRDSLRLDATARTGRLVRTSSESTGCPDESRSLRAVATRIPPLLNGIAFVGPPPGDTVHLALAQSTRAQAADSVARVFPVATGIALGRGRIAVIGDEQLFANDALRVCHWAVGARAVQILDWVAARDSAPPRTSLVFDEYHHGYGPRPSVMRTAATWLTRTPAGRTTLQFSIAGLLLIAVLAPRPVPPRPERTIARRSPLEHVAALADAYEKAGATRTAVRRLVQGVRRRLARTGSARHIADAHFLTLVAAEHPDVAADAERARDALTQRVTPAELIELASSIARIERSLQK